MKNEDGWLPVKSSRIAAIRYKLREEILEIAFHNQQLFIHNGVPPLFWTEMTLAPSIGKYYFNNIRDSFPYKMRRWEAVPDEEQNDDEVTGKDSKD